MEKPEAIFLFGAYLESASISGGLNGQTSSCQLTIVYEKDGPKRTEDFSLNFPEMGTAIGIRIGETQFGGLLQRYSNKMDISGYKWDVILESPNKILEGVQVILDEFHGTGYDGVTDGITFTTQLNNIWNPFAERENYGLGGIFGGANVNSAGYEAVSLLGMLEAFSRGELKCGGPIVYGSSEYTLNLGGLISKLQSITNADQLRIKGPVQSLASIIQEVCEMCLCDYIVEIRPVTGEITENGPISNPEIKIKIIDKSLQPDMGIVRKMVNKYEKEETLISADVGKELSDVVTQRLVIGGPASRVVRTSDMTQLWGKTKGIFPKYTTKIVLDDGQFYEPNITEIRCAVSSFDSWIIYHLIQKYKGVLNPHINAIKSTLFSHVRIDEFTISRISTGAISINELIDTTKSASQQRANAFEGKFVQEQLEKIYNAVKNAGEEYWGRKFLVRLPVEPGGIANNIKFVVQDQQYINSWDIADSGWMEPGIFSDVSFYDGDGRTKAFSLWAYDPSQYDYSSLGNGYAFGGGGIGSTIDVEKDIYWIGNDAFCVIEVPPVLHFDQYTTQKNGLFWLLNTELNIPLSKLASLHGFGSESVSSLYGISPNRLKPTRVGIPQQSTRYKWGPWWYGKTYKGKADVVMDSSLTPETFGSADACNNVGFSYAFVSNSEVDGPESGYVEIPGLPIGSIGDRFVGTGPYLTGIDISYNISGIKTNYKFNTWTPQFGKIAKYNADMLTNVNKNKIRLMQEIRSRLQKPGFNAMKVREAMLVPNMVNVSSMNTIFGSILGPGKVNVQAVSAQNAMAKVNKDHKKSHGCSNEQIFSPVEIKKEVEITEAEDSGSFEGGHIGPTAKELNPYHSNGNDFAIAVHGDEQPESLNLSEQEEMPDKVRVFGVRSPVILSGYGFDLDKSYAPSNDEGTGYSVENIGTDRSEWLTGPLDVKWDSERKVWGFGPDFVEGVLTSNISPASFVDNEYATSFTIRIINDPLNNDQTLTCYNIDPTLSVINVVNKVYVIAMRVGYKWRPIYVGCPANL